MPREERADERVTVELVDRDGSHDARLAFGALVVARYGIGCLDTCLSRELHVDRDRSSLRDECVAGVLDTSDLLRRRCAG